MAFFPFVRILQDVRSRNQHVDGTAWRPHIAADELDAVGICDHDCKVPTIGQVPADQCDDGRQKIKNGLSHFAPLPPMRRR